MSLVRRRILASLILLFIWNLRSPEAGPINDRQDFDKEARMLVKLERTGGFAGMKMSVAVDTDTLSPDDAQELRKLMDAANFFELPPEILGETPGADRFLYTLTAEMENRRHVVHTTEAAADGALKQLINWLTEVGRRGQRGMQRAREK